MDDGREYLAFLMGKNERYSSHLYHKETKGKLTIHYIHGLGRALRPFSSWAHEEGYLEENVKKRLKLPKLPATFPVPLTETEIEKVLSTCLEESVEPFRNFSIRMLFLDTGIRLSELTGLKLSRIDFATGEMTVFGKGSKERKAPVGLQAKKALLQYLSNEYAADRLRQVFQLPAGLDELRSMLIEQDRQGDLLWQVDRWDRLHPDECERAQRHGCGLDGLPAMSRNDW